MFGRLGSLLGRGHLGTEADRTTFRTLHTASLAGPALRLGLTESSAERAVKHIHALLGAPAVALTDTTGVLAWDGRGVHHTDQCSAIAKRVVEDGGTVVVQPADLVCPSPSCEVRRGIVAPLVVEERVVGTLQVFGTSTSAGLLRATEEVAQLGLGPARAGRARRQPHPADGGRGARAPGRRSARTSSTTPCRAIASFVRTDPDRARELLLEFADFTRYSFRQHGEFTTLAEELRSIERYLMLERARFGDRLSVRLQVAPEVLPVTLPFLCLQPLVENAVRHGLEGKAGGGTITIVARDLDRECEITIEDDGVGEDPERVRRALAGDPDSDSVGLANVDERLRSAFGDDYGLVVETAPGAGTKVTVRVPKYAPGVTQGRETPPRSIAGTADRRHPAPARGRRRAAGARRAGVPAGRDDRVGSVRTATPPPRRCGCCARPRSTAVFLDIRMPGLVGLELARVLARFRSPPAVVFVTAYDEHAVDAFELDAVDYVLKPVREERLADAVRRVVRAPRRTHAPRRRAGRRRARRRDPVRQPQRHRVGRGAGRLRPAARRRPEPPGPGAAHDSWRRAGPRPASCASTARCWSTSRTSTRCGWTPAAARSSSAARSSRVSRRHTRELRDLLVRRAKPGAR